MSFRGRDLDNGGMNKMDLGSESRRFGDGRMDDKPVGEGLDDRRYDSNRGRRPPFGRGRRPSPQGRGDRGRDYGYGRDEPPMRDRSPMRPQEDRFSDRYKKDDMPFPKRDDMGHKDMGRSYYDEPPRDRYMEGGRSRLDGPGGFNSRFDGPSDPYKSRSMNFPRDAGPPKSFVSEGFPKPNECEIIAVSKHQRAYAESVEARIKQMGILVDVLFLKDEALLTQTVDDIARRGSLFAMVISQQNETHRSVTVNILHGTPQEHRNMPLDDALKLVSRNFHEYIRMQKEKMERERAERGAYIGAVAADREIQLLLRMLADGRWVSVSEISEVIRYLMERRDKMKSSPGEDRMLGRPSLPPVAADAKLDLPFKPKEDIDVAKKEQDLQDRIMNLMNQGVPPAGNTPGSDLMLPKGDLSPARGNQPRMSPNMNSMRPSSGLGGGIPGLSAPDENIVSQQNISSRGDSLNKPAYSSNTSGASAASGSSSTFINFDNESVQKALDNLMQSGPSLLKNISMTSANLSNPPPSGMSTKPVIDTGMPPPNDPMALQRGGMGPPRGPIGMPDMMGGGQLRGSSNQDMGPPRGSLDMGLPRSNQDIGPPRGNQDLGALRGNQDIGPPRGGPDMGSTRAGQDMGTSRSGGMSDMMGLGSQRGPRSGSDMMGMGPQRGGFGSGPETGGMSSGRGFGSGGGMSDSGMGGPRMSEMGMGGSRLPDSGRMGSGGPRGMGPGNFPNQGQFGKYQGGNQPGNFPGSFNNSSNMSGNMPRPGYGGNMGGGPRRY